jgi:predicted acetyltransferase
MDIDIRPIKPDEFEAYTRAVGRSFGMHPRDEEVAVWRGVTEYERSLAAFEGTEIVGTAAAFSLEVTVPGGRLPMAGITAVGVAPTHRRQGLLTTMMRRQTDDAHEAGELLAGLWASEGVIYQRFGYGMATFAADLEIEPYRSAFTRPLEHNGRVRLVEKADALELFPAVYDRVLQGQPGMLARTPAWWEEIYADLEPWRGGASALFFAIYSSAEGDDEGYLAYRVKHEWPESGPSILKVRELMAASPGAYAALWRFCLDHDLINKIQAWPMRQEEPLLHLLANPRQLNLKLGDGLWIRLLDVPKALASRRYSDPGRIVLEVRDTFCPWNDGRFQLEAGPDGAECVPTEREPDLALEARDLGAAYLGGVRFSALSRAGRVGQLTPDALARADAMFQWDPPPWCPQVF